MRDELVSFLSKGKPRSGEVVGDSTASFKIYLKQHSESISTMGWTTWLSVKTESALRSTRYSSPRTVFLVVVFCTLLYSLWLPVIWSFRGRKTIHAPPPQVTVASSTEYDTLRYFHGSEDCNIRQQDIYSTPWPSSMNVSPFCADRATLLEAFNSGTRISFNTPFIGSGCTYKWFSTPEICMILERFNAITFIGDYLAQSVYTAFTILLHENLLLGGLQLWDMTPEEQESCKCDNQFVSSICLQYAIKSYMDVFDAGSKIKDHFLPYYQNRVPHLYIPFSTIPASPQAIGAFKTQNYNHPNPWKPSPLIFSYAHGSSFSVSTTLLALDEWTKLAAAAQRNIPMLFLGPRSATPGTEAEVALGYSEEIAPLARSRNFDVLNFYNLTLEAEMVGERNFGEKVSLVEAMVIINWLSKLDTS